MLEYTIRENSIDFGNENGFASMIWIDLGEVYPRLSLFNDALVLFLDMPNLFKDIGTYFTERETFTQQEFAKFLEAKGFKRINQYKDIKKLKLEKDIEELTNKYDYNTLLETLKRMNTK